MLHPLDGRPLNSAVNTRAFFIPFSSPFAEKLSRVTVSHFWGALHSVPSFSSRVSLSDLISDRPEFLSDPEFLFDFFSEVGVRLGLGQDASGR